MTTQSETAPKQTAAQRRRARLVARLATIRHWLLGNLGVAPVPGTVFNPRAFFLDPGRLSALLTYWADRARRDGCGAGLPGDLRAAACEQAAQNCLAWFIDTDYRRYNVTGDEFARAVLMAYKRCRRAFWQDRMGDRDAARARKAELNRGSFALYNRAEASRTPDPRRIVHAADALGMDVHAVTGEGICDEVPGDVVNIPGGPSGRGETDGKMVNMVTRDIAVNVAGGAFCRDRLALSIIETRWAMKRGRGKARRLPACTVREGIPTPRGRFESAPAPVAGIPQPAGIINGRAQRQPLPTVTPDDALYNLRRLGRGMESPHDRQRIARAIRRARAVMRG